jgi:hypothetical protein
MKKILKIFLVLTATMAVSCDEDLDINTDPNFPGEITPGLALSAAEGSIASVIGNDLMNVGGFYAQYHTQAPTAGQYESIDQYNLNTAFANSIWTELYSGALNDLKYVREQSISNGDTASNLIAEVLTAYTYQYLVDLFDDVPYSQALQGSEGNITPQVDSGEVIYASLLERIDAAVEMYEANPTQAVVGDQDIIYSSNMERWIEFANTLKLRLHLRMAYTAMADAAAVNELLTENNFLSEDAMFNVFEANTGNRHPFYEVQLSTTGLGDINHVASSTLLNFYTENGDPRVNAVYRTNQAGSHIGIAQGSGDEFNNTAVNYSRPNIGPTTPVFFMTVTESQFLQAEAMIRYAGGTGAKEAYDMGVTESFELYAQHFGLADPGAAAALIAPGGAYEYQTEATVEETVRQVIIQKWAALAYVNNIEAWIETTRTKFPEIVPEGTENYAEGNRIPSRISVLGGVTVPSILFYPDDEVNRNPNINQRGSITENVWWDQKPEN